MALFSAGADILFIEEHIRFVVRARQSVQENRPAVKLLLEAEILIHVVTDISKAAFSSTSRAPTAVRTCLHLCRMNVADLAAVAQAISKGVANQRFPHEVQKQSDLKEALEDLRHSTELLQNVVTE